MKDLTPAGVFRFLETTFDAPALGRTEVGDISPVWTLRRGDALSDLTETRMPVLGALSVRVDWRNKNIPRNDCCVLAGRVRETLGESTHLATRSLRLNLKYQFVSLT